MAGPIPDCDLDDTMHPKPLKHFLCLLLRENLFASLLLALGDHVDMRDVFRSYTIETRFLVLLTLGRGDRGRL